MFVLWSYIYFPIDQYPEEYEISNVPNTDMTYISKSCMLCYKIILYDLSINSNNLQTNWLKYSVVLRTHYLFKML